MSFDPLAAAIDWLDAYRERDLDTLISMFSDDVTVDCSCCVTAIVEGREQVRAFLAERFEDCGASGIYDLKPHLDGASISYVARDGLVTATLKFAADGKIAFIQWGSRI